MRLAEGHLDEAELWARSGAMALTGRADGPPLPCAGAPATAVQRALDTLSELGVSGLPDVGLLSARAASSGGRRRGPTSVGGAFQILPALDGWVGLSLARQSDLELLPALMSRQLSEDPWVAVRSWLASSPAGEAEERIALVGMAGAMVPQGEPEWRRSGVLTTLGGEREILDSPVVVDLSSLWAGPLCAHLVGLSGARVIKVESASRPDGARLGPPEFFEGLHAGHDRVELDFHGELDSLRKLLESADVVIEASRPRALQQLGFHAEEFLAAGTIWVSITAYGREGRDGMRVGFGDDVAAGAGLVAWSEGEPLPAGDALADPLTGVVAGAALVAACRRPRATLLDVSMHDVAVEARLGPRTSS